MSPVTPETAAVSPARRWIGLLAVGLIGGFLSGLFGVGGGIVMVPLLTTVLCFDQRRAAATSLAAIVPTAIAGTISYGIGGQVQLVGAALIGVGGIVGAQLGSRLLRRLPLGWLRWLFVALLAVVAVRTLLEVPARGGELAITPFSALGLIAVGLVMGIASGLFGIGGGILVVPVLIALFGANDLLAKGTSLAAMILTALSGTIANVRAHLVRPVDGLVVGVAAVAASFPGVALAFGLPPLVANLLFAVLVAVSAAQIVIAALRDRRRRRS
ncbi:sulfite exporter TauE/SafE family protein [Schumannella sp. 10F1B-5-1]|uniref:sulfite exporter TauE/SafE family protein n=1 Tax=Schumannella sp. 10F1B-5-1 TaxID=2590780 RepID=UPI00112FFEFE|nr:sulfite exporter TauE/SafE family protein [Schumannella sp. 10F1B-5-1]TPW72240.1 sulfite exporter TauE/SafE family protein [Schumannella sp. 10F1B-5-1]